MALKDRSAIGPSPGDRQPARDAAFLPDGPVDAGAAGGVGKEWDVRARADRRRDSIRPPAGARRRGCSAATPDPRSCSPGRRRRRGGRRAGPTHWPGRRQGPDPGRAASAAAGCIRRQAVRAFSAFDETSAVTAARGARDLESLVGGVIDYAERAVYGAVDPVVAAAALASGFASIRPFVDGQRSPAPLARASHVRRRRLHAARVRAADQYRDGPPARRVSRPLRPHASSSRQPADPTASPT